MIKSFDTYINESTFGIGSKVRFHFIPNLIKKRDELVDYGKYYQILDVVLDVYNKRNFVLVDIETGKILNQYYSEELFHDDQNSIIISEEDPYGEENWYD